MEIDACASFYDDFPSFLNTDCCLDELDDLLKTTENENVVDNSNTDLLGNMTFANYPSPSSSSSSGIGSSICTNASFKTEPDSPIAFNPDEFLNYLSDDDIKSETRSTPSPISSSNSSESNYSYQKCVGRIFPDDPTQISTSNNFTSIITQAPSTGPISLVQSTLIPIQQTQIHTVPIPMGPVTITPKPFQAQILIPNKTTTTPSTIKPKTILLSAKDFKNLMQKVNNNQNGVGNGVPKIIMKSSSPQQPKIMLPKIAQSIDKKPTICAKPVTSTSKSLPTFKGVIDEKTLKKQQRMIKNRESASLSRKKKKDYITSLEHRISDLEKENLNLKEQNTTLHAQIGNLIQNCKCNTIKMAEFVTSKFIKDAESNNCERQYTNGARTQFFSHSRNAKFFTANMKKNTAVLLAMVFMVSLNVGNFQSYFSSGIHKDENFINSDTSITTDNLHNTGRRGLLWVENDVSGPLDFNTTMGINNKTNAVVFPKCPMYINQTENMRLASELRKWIGENDFFNLSSTVKDSEALKFTTKLLAENSELKTLFRDTKEMGNYLKQHKKNFFNKHIPTKKKNTNINTSIEAKSQHPIQIFKSKIDKAYMKLFEEIGRRDDTFYVLSFNSDHILLPASAYNKSSRPKMSLMLPAGDDTLNGEITLMQIDCEVLNTTLVQLKHESIPENVRPHAKLNVNDRSSTTVENTTRSATRRAQLLKDHFPESDGVLNFKKSSSKIHNSKLNQIYRPYFINADIDDGKSADRPSLQLQRPFQIDNINNRKTITGTRRTNIKSDNSSLNVNNLIP